MDGKIVLITGASQGIGRATAVGLAKLGATVVIAGRDRARTEAAVAQIKSQSGRTDLAYLLADFLSLAAVQQMAQDFLARYPRLDVLINNAGVFNMRREASKDGYEATFAVNHLAPFLLTTSLLERLKTSAPARIVNVSSAAHQGAHIDFDDLMGAKRYGGWMAYGQSKLANVLFTRELARRLAGTGVTANAMHPGFVASGFARNNGRLARAVMSLAKPFSRSPEKGAETAIYLASSPEVEGISGEYFIDCRTAASSAESYDEEAQRKLWEASEKLVSVPG